MWVLPLISHVTGSECLTALSLSFLSCKVAGGGNLTVSVESPLDCKEIQPVHPKGNQPWTFIERTDAEVEAPVLWPPMQGADSLEKTLTLRKIEGRRRRGRQRMKWLDSITDSILNQFWEMVEVREAWRAAVRGVAKSQTQLSS